VLQILKVAYYLMHLFGVGDRLGKGLPPLLKSRELRLSDLSFWRATSDAVGVAFVDFDSDASLQQGVRLLVVGILQEGLSTAVGQGSLRVLQVEVERNPTRSSKVWQF